MDESWHVTMPSADPGFRSAWHPPHHENDLPGEIQGTGLSFRKNPLHSIQATAPYAALRSLDGAGRSFIADHRRNLRGPELAHSTMLLSPSGIQGFHGRSGQGQFGLRSAGTEYQARIGVKAEPYFPGRVEAKSHFALSKRRPLQSPE
jgi:hypothetical protein